MVRRIYSFGVTIGSILGARVEQKVGFGERYTPFVSADSSKQKIAIFFVSLDIVRSVAARRQDVRKWNRDNKGWPSSAQPTSIVKSKSKPVKGGNSSFRTPTQKARRTNKRSRFNSSFQFHNPTAIHLSYIHQSRRQPFIYSKSSSFKE
jgi:hypothetical protein